MAKKKKNTIEDSDRIVIHTDGSLLSGNRGGWSALTEYPDGRKEVMSGGVKDTTNNKMEMTGVIKALQNLPDNAAVAVVSDSEYTVKGSNVWIHNWKKNNWTGHRTSQPVKNKELWLEIDKQKARLDIKFSWTRAHQEDSPIQNQLADILAKEEANKLA